MNARRGVETVLADYFRDNVTIPGVIIRAGRSDGTLQDPFLCVLAEEVMEQSQDTGVYLGDVKVVVITNSNDEKSSLQDGRIQAALDQIRKLSAALRNNNMILVDEKLNITIDGLAQISQTDSLDEQSFGDMVYLRVGFRDTSITPAFMQ